ncbi:MAG: hypothetical protein JST42_22760 [Bacteroidetes bacterium]|nr:hypothetical protein [Bacteroidota bacterium]
MKKLVFLSVIFTRTMTGFSEKQAFIVKYSEPLAVYEFVSNLSANAPDNNFKKLYLASAFNLENYRRLITRFDSLNIDLSYEYTDYPYGQKIGGSTISLLRKELVNAADLSHFRLNAIGIIPNADLQTLSEVLVAFEPVYRQIVYEPGRAGFENQLDRLRRLIDSVDMSTWFSMGLKVYNSSWDQTIPFQFVFYPMPKAKGFSATALYNIAISGIPADYSNYDKVLGVMLHEIFHIEYDEESLAFKKNIRQWFAENPRRTSRYAYLLLNEAMATAMGNGYVYGRLIGGEDTAAWYNRKYTNWMAKKMYSLVRSYIDNGRSIDRPFVDRYIQLYDDNFREWITEKDNVLTDRYVLSDSAADFDVIDANYPYRSMSQYETGISRLTLEKIKKAPITKIVIISKDNRRRLSLLKQTFAELSNWTPAAARDFNHSVWLNDRTWLIIINEIQKGTEAHLKTLTIK